MYRVSDIKKYIHCQRSYYLAKDDNLAPIAYLRNDESLSLLLKDKLKIDNYFLGVKGDPKERFLKAFDDYEWFIKARLESDELRVKIPIIHKLEDGIEVYFTYYGLYPKDNEADYYSWHIQVLKNNGFTIKKIYIIHINQDYVYQDSLDVDKLFVLSEYLYSEGLKPSLKLDSLICRKFNIPKIIRRLKNHSLSDYPAIRKKACKGKNNCPYYQKCFQEDLSEDSILTLCACKNKELMYQSGIKKLADVDIAKIEGTKVQYAQIMASRNGGIFYDNLALKAFLKPLSQRPICFIDFEWDRYLIPKYNGLKPGSVICFEYAVYVLNENGELLHNSFVGIDDCRKSFIESLLKDIPDRGPIVAYNAIGAEKLRILELAKQFKEYEKALLNIADRLVDLSYPFVNGMVYSTKMKGIFSLKKLVSVVSDYSYANLDIHDGMMAVSKWRDLDMIDEDSQEIKLLKAYCSLDAYGLYLVYEWLLKISSKSNYYFHK